MQKVETPNNTPAQVDEYLRAALHIVEELEPPEDLREAVFTAAVNLVSGKQIALVQEQPFTMPDLAIPRGRR